MTTPYEKNLPCLNTNCKSHGRPHPNCRCYFSDGGEVVVCSGPHNPDCEYYMESGGVVFDPSTAKPTEEAEKNTEFDPSTASPTEDLGGFDPSTAKPTEDKYTTPGQQALTAIEAAGRGFAGPIATGAELGLSKLGVPGLSAEEQTARSEANPTISTGTELATTAVSMLYGVGEAGFIAKAAKAIPNIERLGKVGTAAVKMGLQTGLFQASTEAVKGLLGQGDPEAPVSSALANITAATLLGTATGGLLSGTGLGLQKIGDTKMVSGLHSFIAGLGGAVEASESKLTKEAAKVSADAAKKELQRFGYDVSGYDWGQKAGKALSSKALGALAGGYEGYKESREGGISGALRGFASGYISERWIIKGASDAVPVFMKLLSSGAIDSIPAASRYIGNVLQGENTIGKSISSLMAPGVQKAYDFVHSEKDRERLNKVVEDGGVNKQAENELQSHNQIFLQNRAKGGKIVQNQQEPPEPNHLATAFPEQATLLSAAKGRIYGYLNNIRPQKNLQKLPYDDEPNQKEQKRAYEQALDLANKPLSILNNVKDGSLTPQQMKHFTSMYPELHSHLSKKITEKIMESQMNGERPKYKTRQGMSLFLGAALDSTFTPMGIQAAQSVFAMNKPQQQAAPGGKKGASTLSKTSASYLTDDQARERRAQTQKA